MTFQIKQSADITVTDFSNEAWSAADELLIERYWSGGEAPPARHVGVRGLWSDAALYIKFEANRGEPIVASEWPDKSEKTIGLWDRDVCEVFIAPDPHEPRHYFEFEVAPTGEWLDVAIDLSSGTRINDWEFTSGMRVASKIELDRILMSMMIPWDAFGKKPQPGDVWRGNLYRCVGEGEDRGYLAWQRTMTPVPDFHVPESFGEFRFIA
jgi:hypothetical protein